MITRRLKSLTLMAGLGTLLSDQILKLVLLRKIPADGFFLIQSSPFTVKIDITLNPFISFGFPVPLLLIYCLTVFLLIGLSYFLVRSITKISFISVSSFSVIIGAALSNFIDRIIHGGVVDYLGLSFYNYHWATFNLADSLISLAAIILIIETFRKKI
jgi:lipoprotein signal peptidase